MRKLIILFLILLHGATGIMVALASSSSINSSQGTMTAQADKSPWIILEPNTGVGYKDNTVYKNGNALVFNFAAGLGDREGEGSFGFQPNSTYRFEKLFKVTNASKKSLDMWITVHEAFEDFDWIHIYSDNGWDKTVVTTADNPMTLEGNESFYMSIDFVNLPKDASLGTHPGQIVFHTRFPDDVVVDRESEVPKEAATKPDSQKEKPDDADIPKTGSMGFMMYLMLTIMSGGYIIYLWLRQRKVEVERLEG